jgi:hypothetical protein
MIFDSRRSAMVIGLTIFAIASLFLAGYDWIAVLLVLLLVLFSVPQRYEVRERELVVRHGFLRRRYAYEQIQSVEMEPDGGSAEERVLSLVLRMRDRRQVCLNPREPAALRTALEEKIREANAATTDPASVHDRG